MAEVQVNRDQPISPILQLVEDLRLLLEIRGLVVVRMGSKLLARLIPFMTCILLFLLFIFLFLFILFIFYSYLSIFLFL